MVLLDGALQRIFGAVLGPLYLPATLHRASLSPGDRGGTTVRFTDHPVRLQFIASTEAMRADRGFSARSVGFLVLRDGQGRDPTTDDQVSTIRRSSGAPVTERWAIVSVSRDDADVHWIIHGVPA